MEKELKILPLITARGGSKGLPGKNIMSFHGHPLIAWTIEVIKKSNFGITPLVSTDSPEIQKVSLQYGASVPFTRPESLSSDSATSVDVALHALDFFESNSKEKIDAVFLFQPTTPIRDSKKINEMISKLNENWDQLDAVVGVGESKPSPAYSLLGDGSHLKFTELFNSSRRQEQQSFYSVYGSGWLIKAEALRVSKTFYPDKMGYTVFDREECIDIDDKFDFELALKMYDFAKSKFTVSVPEIV